MELEYENIAIRRACVADAALLTQWWNDGGVMAHAGFPNGLGTTVRRVITQIEKERDDTIRRYLVLIDGARIGEMYHRQLNPLACEIGIKICVPEMQNRGYGKKILSLFISGLFDCLGYQKIQLDTDLENTRAQYVYESLGFQKLGVNHNSWIDQLGRGRSSVDYSLTQEQFHSWLEEAYTDF